MHAVPEQLSAMLVCDWFRPRPDSVAAGPVQTAQHSWLCLPSLGCRCAPSAGDIRLLLQNALEVVQRSGLPNPSCVHRAAHEQALNASWLANKEIVARLGLLRLLVQQLFGGKEVDPALDEIE